jgi:hypothetical protein
MSRSGAAVVQWLRCRTTSLWPWGKVTVFRLYRPLNDKACSDINGLIARVHSLQLSGMVKNNVKLFKKHRLPSFNPNTTTAAILDFKMATKIDNFLPISKTTANRELIQRLYRGF